MMANNFNQRLSLSNRTQWPWPSLVSRAIWRKYMPKPMDPGSQYRRSIFHRLSLVYFAVAWSVAGIAVYMVGTRKSSDTESSSSNNLNWAPYVFRKETLEQDKVKVFSYQIKGLTVVESTEISAALIAKKREMAGEPPMEDDNTTKQKKKSGISFYVGNKNN